MQQMTPRRDPAPSRWSYRYERWMLTPAYRRLFRYGPPVLVVAAIVGGVLASAERREWINDTYHSYLRQFQQRPEFMVSAMSIDGADERITEEVRASLPINFPVSSFDLDLEVMRQTVEALNGVQKATLRVQPGGILNIEVVPRIPAAVLRQDEELRLIDAQGHFVAALGARSDRADLPLIAGDGARDQIAEALALFTAAGPLAPQILGLVRMGERRWDVILDQDRRILLPEQNAVTALERVVVMVQAQRLLERDVLVVDMRNEDRPTLRLGEGGVTEIRRINAAVAGTGR